MNTYNLVLKITANTMDALSKISGLRKKTEGSFSGGFSAGLGSISGIFSKLGGAVTMIGGILVDAFSTAFSFVGKIVTSLFSVSHLLMGGLLGGGAIAGAVYGAHKALGPAAEMERYRGQLSIQGKENLMPFFAQTAAKTPYSLNEVVSSGILMENFNISSEKFLSTVIDAAAAFKKPVEEVVRSMGYIKTGRYGEGIESLAQIGITRDDLKDLGIKFEKSGGVAQASQSKIFDAVITAMKSRFGGTSERISETYEGKISNLGDAIFQSFANAFQKVLPYATASIGYITDAIASIGNSIGQINWVGMGEALVNSVSKAADWFASIDWAGWGQTVVNTAESVANAFGRLFTGEGRDQLIQGISGAWNVIKNGIPSIMTGIVTDLRNTGKWMGDYIELSIGRALDFSVGGLTIGNLIAMGIEKTVLGGLNLLRIILVEAMAGFQTIFSWLIMGLTKAMNAVLPKSMQIDLSFLGAKMDGGKRIDLAKAGFGEVAKINRQQWYKAIPELPKSSVDTVTDSWSEDYATRQKRMLLESKQPFKSATYEAVSGITPDLWKNLQGLFSAQSGPGAKVTENQDLAEENRMAEQMNKEYNQARAAEAKEAAKQREEAKALAQETLKAQLTTNNILRKFTEVSQSAMVEGWK